jgi:F-type H+-transporting ATPase subunit delta
MKIPKQAKRSAKALFQQCLVEGVLDENRVRRVVDEVVVGKPRGYLPILNHFERLVKLELQRRAAAIESSVELSPEQRRQIEAQLQARYGRGLSYTYTTNPGLIGGARIQVGSDVYDGTVVGRLRALQESFQVA